MFRYTSAAATYGAAAADVEFLTNDPHMGAKVTKITLPSKTCDVALMIVNSGGVSIKYTILGSNDGVNWAIVQAEDTVLTTVTEIASLSNVAYAFLKVSAVRDSTDATTAFDIRVTQRS
jgi:hypothetical protein